jgi:hypothetical protein
MASRKTAVPPTLNVPTAVAAPGVAVLKVMRVDDAVAGLPEIA